MKEQQTAGQEDFHSKLQQAGRDFHKLQGKIVVTEPYVCSLYECKSHKETCIHQTHREEMKEQQTAGQEGIFTRKLLRNLTFAPCMNASLTKRPAFTKHIEKK